MAIPSKEFSIQPCWPTMGPTNSPDLGMTLKGGQGVPNMIAPSDDCPCTDSCCTGGGGPPGGAPPGGGLPGPGGLQPGGSISLR
jgi:hypothetical protein